MISCRVALNELPVAVAEEVLCVDEVSEDTANWSLLSDSPTSRCYKFTPRTHERSWFVRWGFDYSFTNLRETLFGRDDATRDWRNVGHAERCRIPVVHYRFLGTPRLVTASLDTLMVTEFLDDARPLKTFFADESTNLLLVEETLIQLAELLAAMHGNAIIHNNFRLENTLIQYDDATRLTPTDWYDMQVNRSSELAPFKKDLIGPLRDLTTLGYSREHLQSFLEAYGNRMQWSSDQLEDVYVQAANASLRDQDKQ
jgi:hypothetical protein